MSSSKKIWIGLLAYACLMGVNLPVYAQPCPPPNPILGANEVCPGSQTPYTMTFDNRPTSTYTWELFGTGGQILGVTNGVSINIQWQNANGGPYLLRCTEQVGMCFMQNELYVTVADDLARRPFNCYSELSIPFDENCEKLILPEHLLTTGAPDCPNSFVVELSIDEDIPVSNPVGIEYLGQIITAKVLNPLSGRACISRVLLKDGSAPDIFCENDTTLCNDPLAWEPFHPDFKVPTAIDNCSDQVPLESQGYEWVQLFNDPLFDAYIVRSWQATDKYNNRSSCEDTIFLRRIIFNQVVCPPDTVVACDAATFDPSNPLTSGVPTFDGYPLWSNRSYCDFTIKYEDLYAFKCPGTYTIHRYWYLSQITPTMINEDTCHQIIEVVDTVGPWAKFNSPNVKKEVHTDIYGLPNDRAYNTIHFPTLDYDCLAYGYFPNPTVYDNCTNADSVIVDLIWENGHINYVNGSPRADHLRFENLSKGKHIVTIKLRDLCHNTSYDTLIVVAEDKQAPYLVVDQHPVVSLNGEGQVTWIDVSVFDEGTWDNCGIEILLARRVDWWKNGVDLCDSISKLCEYGHDTLYCANLESDKHLNEVESYYNEQMRWLKEDGSSCSALLWNAWRYDLCKKGTLECMPYSNKNYDKFKELYTSVSECTEDLELEGHHPGNVDDWDRIGGGWSKEVPFFCTDACSGQKVTIEIIALDAYCNYSKIWVDVLVEDKSVPKVQHYLPDLEISCWAYNNYYRDSVEHGQWNVFGSYQSFKISNYPTLEDRNTIIYDRLCEPTTSEEAYYQLTQDTILNGLVYENCDLIIKETQKVHFERCGVGWIERHFVFKGGCNTSEADSVKVIQRINIFNDCPLQEHEIVWPVKDTTIYGCGYVNVKTEQPRLKHEDECREIGIHYKDRIVDILYNADSTCLKVIRSWAVIDWCRQNAPYHEDWIGNQNYHYYEYDQIIYIKNTEAPVISDCDIDAICIGSNCTADLRKSITVTDDCSPADQIAVSWVLYEATEFGFLPLDQGDTNYVEVLDLPMGDYKLVWQAEDACHNVSYCTDQFYVKDCVKPSPVCLTNTTVRLLPVDVNQDGQIDTAVGEIWAQELNVSSYDNCFLDIDFRIRLKGTGNLDQSGQLLPPDSTQKRIGFGCEDIGVQEVEMWVVDQSGNADYCLALVNIIAPVEGCKGELGKVKGTVSSIQGAGIANVYMLLQNLDETRQVLTNNQGRYDFKSYAMDGSDYQLWPEKYDDPIDGINTSDVIRLSKHLLLKEPLKNELQLKAADVNNDGSVSVLDIITLRKLLLGKIDSLPIQNPWQFFNVKGQSQSSLSLGIDYKPLLNFTGVKIGDLNGDITNYSASGRNLTDVAKFYYADERFVAGQDLEVSIYITEPLDLDGLQMELSLDQDRLQLVGIEGERIGLADGEWSNLNNRLLLSWINEVGETVGGGEMLRIRLKSIGDGQLSEAIGLTSSRLHNELYYQDQVIPIKLLPKQSESVMIIGQNVPNPFHHTTVFQLQISEPTSVIINMKDLSGHIYVHRLENFTKGIHEIAVYSNQLGASGLYLFQVSTSEVQITKKMILLE